MPRPPPVPTPAKRQRPTPAAKPSVKPRPAAARAQPGDGAPGPKRPKAKATTGARKAGASASPATPVRARAPARAVPDKVWARRVTRLRRVPGFVWFFASVVLLALLIPTVNWVYQVIRKPSELFFPISDDWYKTPAETWRTYAPLFLAHSTPIMTPELLAALAQKEASGNPVARTYWRWSATRKPFEIYRPASSAVGMYQFTDGTFDEARGYCIRDHRVVADGPWHDWDSCWFNSLYMRVVPSHAVELAASNLDRRVREILQRKGIRRATLRQQQELAIITHLCGAGAGAVHAARGLRLRQGQRCGDHDASAYVGRVMGLMRTFATLRQRT